MPTKAGDDDRAPFEWGGILVVHEVFQREDGSLAVAPPETVREAFSSGVTLGTFKVGAADGIDELLIAEDSGDIFHLTAKLVVAAGTRSMSLRLYEDVVTGQAYEFIICPGEQRLTFDRRPNYPWYQYDNRGLDRPLQVTAERPLQVELIVDDSIATLYIEGVALNARMNRPPGTALTVSVIDGQATLHDVVLSRGIRR